MSNPRSTGPACGNNPNHPLSEGDRQAIAEFRAYLEGKAALRARIARALYQHDQGTGLSGPGATPREHHYREADAVLAVLPAPADRAAVLRWAADDLADAFGDPTAKHIGALGASHLRRLAREIEAEQANADQSETPMEKRLRFSERRNDELRAECRRRGKAKAEQAETIQRLEKQLDEVRTQLGAEILRAGQAEAELRRLAGETPAATDEARGVQEAAE